MAVLAVKKNLICLFVQFPSLTEGPSPFTLFLFWCFPRWTWKKYHGFVSHWCVKLTQHNTALFLLNGSICSTIEAHALLCGQFKVHWACVHTQHTSTTVHLLLKKIYSTYGVYTLQLQEYSRLHDNQRILIQLHETYTTGGRSVPTSWCKWPETCHVRSYNSAKLEREFFLRLSCSHVSIARVRSAYSTCLRAVFAHPECDLFLMISWGWTAVYTAVAYSECDLNRVKIGPLLRKETCPLCVQEELVQCLHAVNLLPQPSHTGVGAVAALGSTLHTPACNQLVASSLLTHLWVIGRHPQYKTPASSSTVCVIVCSPCVYCVCEICQELFFPSCVHIICSFSTSHNHYSHAHSHSYLSSLASLTPLAAVFSIYRFLPALLWQTIASWIRYSSPIPIVINNTLQTFFFPHTITVCSWFSYRVHDTSVCVTELLPTITCKPSTIKLWCSKERSQEREFVRLKKTHKKEGALLELADMRKKNNYKLYSDEASNWWCVQFSCSGVSPSCQHHSWPF